VEPISNTALRFRVVRIERRAPGIDLSGGDKVAINNREVSWQIHEGFWIDFDIPNEPAAAAE